MSRYTLLFLILSISIGIFFRFYQITSIPPPISHDEAAIGYNAFSLLHTSRDEYGKKFPLLFRSFDDYKLPGMIYSTVLSIATFGPNEMGIRFPSAFYGVVSIVVFFLILLELLTQNEQLYSGNSRVSAAIVTLFFALSPWHINFSRQNFESNGALFFLLAGIYFLLRFNTKRIFLIPAAIFLVVSIYFYYSVRLIIPPILLVFTIVNFKRLKQDYKNTILAILVGIVLLTPFLPALISRGGTERIRMVSVLADDSYLERLKTNTEIIAHNNTIINRLIYNRRVALLQAVIDNYYKNITFEHVFIKGVGRSGLQYLFELPLIFIGIWSLSKQKKTTKWILLTWLLAYPLSGALTNQQPNALRTLPGAPVMSLLSAIGCLTILNLFRSKFSKIIAITSILIIFSYSAHTFFYNYFYKFPYDNPTNFGDGQKQMVQYVTNNQNNYDTIVITGHYWRPYIFMLFWQAYNPTNYQISGKPDRFDKYIFGRAEWDNSGILLSDPKTDLRKITGSTSKTLFILTPTDYENHKEDLILVSKINGNYTQSIFLTAKLIMK